MDLKNKPLLLLDVVIDPICPWCYVGYRALDWAVMALSFSNTIEVRYRPYRLDPETPPEGRDRAATLARKFPDASQREAAAAGLKVAMQDIGLDFDPASPSRIPDTTAALRLMRWAQQDVVQRAVVDGLFAAYWVHGEDIGQPQVLAQVAAEAQMDAEDVVRRLATKEDRVAVSEEAQAFRDGGVSSVPTFIVNEQAGFAGALPKAQMAEALKRLAAETEAPAE